MKEESFPTSERVIFKPFEIEGRTIYPVVDVFVIEDCLNLLSVTPVAIIVEEKEESYILNLSYQEIDDDELYELLSSSNYK